MALETDDDERPTGAGWLWEGEQPAEFQIAYRRFIGDDVDLLPASEHRVTAHNIAYTIFYSTGLRTTFFGCELTNGRAYALPMAQWGSVARNSRHMHGCVAFMRFTLCVLFLFLFFLCLATLAS